MVFIFVALISHEFGFILSFCLFLFLHEFIVIDTKAKHPPLCVSLSDPQRQIIDITLAGVRNILSACEKAARAGSLRRFVHTSSIAAVAGLDVFRRDESEFFDKICLIGFLDLRLEVLWGFFSLRLGVHFVALSSARASLSLA